MRSVMGFTVIELMIALVLSAILISIAIPGFQQMVASNAADGTAKDFISTHMRSDIPAV